MARRPVAAAAAAVLCAFVFAPGAASAHGGASAAGFRFVLTGIPLRAVVARPFPLRLRPAFRRHGFPFRRGAAEPVVFGPPGLLEQTPPGYGERYYEPRLPVWRECISETRMVPSSTRAGLTPVGVTRCWRRN